MVSAASTSAGPCRTVPSDSESRRNTSTSTGPSPRSTNTDRVLTGTAGARRRRQPGRHRREPGPPFARSRSARRVTELDSDPIRPRPLPKRRTYSSRNRAGTPVGVDGLGGVARQWDAELPALTLEPHVGLERQRAVLRGHSVGDEIGAAPSHISAQTEREQPAVDGHGRGERPRPLPTQRRGGGAVGGEHGREVRHDTRRAPTSAAMSAPKSGPHPP